MDAGLRRALGLMLALFTASALAQSWPQRAVHVIVPFVAGGNTDSQARIVCERLNELLSQPLVVENKVGAGGAIAAEYVAKSAPDGYTLFFAASPQFSLPLVQRVNFDPFKDFAPISIVGTNAFVLGVHVSVPANTVQQFVDFVKAHPGQLNYASAGAGTTTHLTAALFLARAGLQMTHVPYKGGAQAVADLVGGQVQMYFGNASELIPHSQGGKIRLLAVSSAKRTPQLPDVPALAETYPGFATGTWNGFLAPTGTPRAIIERLAQEVAKVVHEPATAERLRKIGVEPLGNTPAQFGALVQREAPIWRDAVKAAGIRAD
jgi:tripartite-type tricarboxylate transporter receptor subunit TctC